MEAQEQSQISPSKKEYYRLYSRRKYNERKLAGACTRCGFATEGATYCKECKELKSAKADHTYTPEMHERKKKNIKYKLARRMRSRLHSVLGSKESRFGCSAVRDLGCTLDELEKHLASKFVAGMTWSNHGTHWHIDHIKPLASFDLTRRDEILKACHYTNLQPLWAVDNLIKGAKYD